MADAAPLTEEEMAELEALRARAEAEAARSELEALRAKLYVPAGAVLRVEGAGEFDGYYREDGGRAGKPAFVNTSNPTYKIYYRVDPNVCPGWRWCLSDHDHGGYDGRGFYNECRKGGEERPPERGWKEGSSYVPTARGMGPPCGWKDFGHSSMQVIYGPF
jgi:hypothetical protein